MDPDIVQETSPLLTNNSEVLKLPEEQVLHSCCIDSVRAFALNNPMMVCQTCKYLIKCFKNPVSFKNYLTFCQSRKRKVTIGIVDEYSVVIFRNYEPYKS